MNKKEFLALADKYEQGKCSEQEKLLLYKFCDQAQLKTLIDNWDLSEESQTRIRLLKRITETIHAENRKTEIKNKFRRYRNIAAVLTGIGIGGYFYFQEHKDSKKLISQNAITLELEDGTVQELNENESNFIVHNKGNTIVKQNGNKLVYQNEKNDSETKLSYNTLSVPYGRNFELELSDGTIAYLNSGTSIKYPTKFIKGNNRQIFVTGEVYLSVAKDSVHPFVVNTGDLNIQVLGTEFNVNAYPEDDTQEVVLVEGSVALYNQNKSNNNNRETILTPGDKAVFNKNNKVISTSSVITNVYTSWMSGELVFRNMSFENIVKKLERHYNIKIINKNSSINKTVFNASFGNESIEFILQSLKENYGIDYSIKGENIIIN
ncbi:FecR family protein [Wenyingzhuangia sp. 1_MG-2023]|nr:FecR family protein [Wenyingzhuangia sp. 1_MG-2023]